MNDFEAWYFGMFPLEKAMIEAGSGVAARNRDLYLRCWQASRTAVVVELPEAYETDADGHWLIRRSEVKKIIEAQGLKVKP